MPASDVTPMTVIRTDSSPRGRRGFVLPVVLVVLTVLTGLAVTQMKRTVTDERLAANARETVMLDNAAQTTLRWCEWHVIDQPRTTVTVSGTSATPAWRIPANWSDANSLNFTGTTLVPGMNGDPTCIVEDATCELQPPVSPTGMDTDGCNGIDSRWRKFRITARVRVMAPDLAGGVREVIAQSELRLFGD
jgi:hypothetical protein